MAETSYTYSDFDMNFIAHPVKKDVVRVTDTEAIKRSVLNLLLTNFYERPFKPELGSRVRELLFENFTPFTEELIEKAILETLENHEPRVRVNAIEVEGSPDENGFRVKVIFFISNAAEPVELNTFLERVR
jgi:phage baseplate assembly protein W